MRFLTAFILCFLVSSPDCSADDSDHYGTDFGQLYDPRFDAVPARNPDPTSGPGSAFSPGFTPSSAGIPNSVSNVVPGFGPVFRPGSGLNLPNAVPGFVPGSELKFPDLPPIGPNLVPDSGPDPAPAFGKESALTPSRASSSELYSDSSVQSPNDWSGYLRLCEKRIAQSWTNYSVHSYKLPEHFKKHAKGVVSFELNSAGKVSKMKVRHSSAESLRIAALRQYPSRAVGLLKAIDNSMIDAIETSTPLPAPPRKLQCPRRFVVVFDADRFKPLRMYLDDKIPVYASSMPQALIWKTPF